MPYKRASDYRLSGGQAPVNLCHLDWQLVYIVDQCVVDCAVHVWQVVSRFAVDSDTERVYARSLCFNECLSSIFDPILTAVAVIVIWFAI